MKQAVDIGDWSGFISRNRPLLQSEEPKIGDFNR
jgi:hypothetical protein